VHAAQLTLLLDQVFKAMPNHADELRKLDAALGDGDLGITVSAGAQAAQRALAEAPVDASIAELIQAVAKAFSTANPSTFAALVGGGLLAGSKTLRDVTDIDRDAALGFVRAATDRIMERGKASLGDKTMVDALLPSIDALAASTAVGLDAIDDMVVAAQEAVDRTASLQSAKGRAAWVQERGMGHHDPGATAYLRLLQELRSASKG
jgi:dihydroxyacetone kinase-like protein